MTTRQLELLDFIKAYIAEHRTPPSYEEMMNAMGLKSKSGIHRIVKALVERGEIVQLRGRARSIEIATGKTKSDELVYSPLWMEIEKTFTDHYVKNVSAAQTLRDIRCKINELGRLRS